MSWTCTPGHLLGCLRRRCGLDANPVRRAIDRAEAWIRAGLAVAFLAGAPALGVGLSHWTGVVLAGQARAQAVREYLIPATLLASARPEDSYPGTGPSYSWAPAWWTGPDGTRRVGVIAMRPGAGKGSVERIWTDRYGNLAPAPLAQAQIANRMTTVGLLAPLGLGLLLLTVAGVVHRLLDRRRMAAWEADWTMVEPRWSRGAR